jgi:hypothetical protein
LKVTEVRMSVVVDALVLSTLCDFATFFYLKAYLFGLFMRKNLKLIFTDGICGLSSVKAPNLLHCKHMYKLVTNLCTNSMRPTCLLPVLLLCMQLVSEQLVE